MALEPVDELLFGQSVNLLGHEHLIMAQGRDEAASQGEAFVQAANFACGASDEPTLVYHLVNLLGVGHHLQA